MSAPIVLESSSPRAGLSFAERELATGRALLESNGYAADPAGWRDALRSEHPALRAIGYQLLAEEAAADDVGLFERGLTDDDGATRAWAAFGLERVRPGAGREVLRSLAADSLEFAEYGPLIAATALARLGDGAGIETIARADATQGARIAVVRQLFWFGRLGAAAVWPLYERALADDTPGVRALALMQLRELDGPEARALVAREALRT